MFVCKWPNLVWFLALHMVIQSGSGVSPEQNQESWGLTDVVPRPKKCVKMGIQYSSGRIPVWKQEVTVCHWSFHLHRITSLQQCPLWSPQPTHCHWVCENTVLKCRATLAGKSRNNADLWGGKAELVLLLSSRAHALRLWVQFPVLNKEIGASSLSHEQKYLSRMNETLYLIFTIAKIKERGKLNHKERETRV